MFNIFKQVSDEQYQTIMSRYAKFQDSLNDASSEPINVFDPLGQRSLDDLTLVRKVSQDLQKKKEEDIRKAALAATVGNKKEIQEVVDNPAEKEDA